MESIRWTTASSPTLSDNATERQPLCHPSQDFESTILFTMSAMGTVANVALIALVCMKKPSKRYHQSWSQGLLLHQALVDLGRAVLLIFLGSSVLMCQKLSKCYLIDTSFLLLATVSTVNMLTMLINDAPIFPEHEQLGSISAAVAGANRLRVSLYFLPAFDCMPLFPVREKEEKCKREIRGGHVFGKQSIPRESEASRKYRCIRSISTCTRAACEGNGIERKRSAAGRFLIAFPDSLGATGSLLS